MTTAERPLATLDKNYDNIHHWIRYHFGRAEFCSFNKEHTSKKFEWANVDGIYEKDIKHFIQLCRSCHAKIDTRESTRQKYRNRKGKITRNRVIEQLSLDGRFIAKHFTIAEASRTTGANRTGIINFINNPSLKHCGGFIWRYVK